MKHDLKKACYECPFRKKAMKGYIGPYDTPEELVQTAKYVPFPCHKTMQTPEREQFCYGAAGMMNKSCHSSRDPETREYQKLVGKPDGIMDERETIKHHE